MMLVAENHAKIMQLFDRAFNGKDTNEKEDSLGHHRRRGQIRN
jgi:hypothetical protein